MNTPKIKHLANLIMDIKQSHGVTKEGLDFTIGWNPKSRAYGWQTGDNSYSGAAYFYPIWAVGTIYPRTNSRKLAKELINQLLEQVSQ